MASDPLQCFSQTGRYWLRNAVSTQDLKHLSDLFPAKDTPGARLPADDALFRTVSALPFQDQIKAVWPGMRPVRMVTFNKSSASNWGVPWHQDRIINVAEKTEMQGFTNWSQKQGAWHCEPPRKLLSQMLFVRLHIDASTPENGAMQIALGSHKSGLVPAAQADTVAQNHPTETTCANPGDVMIMAMTLLHKSDPAPLAVARRTLRIDYAAFDLPAPLKWAAYA